jgi:hypothetical protein
MTGSKKMTQKKQNTGTAGESGVKPSRKTVKLSGTKGPESGKGLEHVRITDSTDLEIYLPDEYPADMVRPKSWELQSRKSFYQWLLTNFNKYELLPVPGKSGGKTRGRGS